jgi:hypothetical protein
MFMRYVFRPHRTIFRQHIIKESTALCTMSVALLSTSLLLILVLSDVCSSYLIAAVLCFIGCAAPLVVCFMCWFVFFMQTTRNAKINNNNDVL